MTEKTITSAAPTQAAVHSDPLGALIAILRGDGENARAGREVVAGMAQRPWQQLPSRLKSAVREDVRRLLAENHTAESIAASGYGSALTAQVLRDIGRA